jgi:uncharacterized membrane protein YfcA
MPDLTTVLSGVAVVLLGAFLKGIVGFGFPTIATSLLALFVDVKIAVPLVILPNIVMDGVQMARRGRLLSTARRLAVVLIAGAVGIVAGTKLLVMLPAWVAMLVLGAFTLAFVALNATPLTPRLGLEWEKPLGPGIGLVSGIVGGLTNTPGTALVIFFYALGFPKEEFIRSIALSFVTLKLVQFTAVARFGLMSWSLFGLSVGLTGVALVGFSAGLRVQDRLEQRTFNRAVLVFLALLGIWLIVRALASR